LYIINCPFSQQQSIVLEEIILKGKLYRIDLESVQKHWRYQKDNQKSYIEGQTIQWLKEKGQLMMYKYYKEI
jgi:hypothetical protein